MLKLILIFAVYSIIAAVIKKRAARKAEQAEAQGNTPVKSVGKDLLEQLVKELGLPTSEPQPPRPAKPSPTTAASQPQLARQPETSRTGGKPQGPSPFTAYQPEKYGQNAEGGSELEGAKLSRQREINKVSRLSDLGRDSRARRDEPRPRSAYGPTAPAEPIASIVAIPMPSLARPQDVASAFILQAILAESPGMQRWQGHRRSITANAQQKPQPNSH
jgi:hypothetical protein